MTPSDLTAESFAFYSPRAKEIAVANLAVLRRMPLALAGLLLKEVRGYDWKFPMERREVDVQFRYLSDLPKDDFDRSMADFASLRIDKQIAETDWINAPDLFSQRLSAMLWATSQIETFRRASIQYVNAYRQRFPDATLPAPRLIMIAVGKGVKEENASLFRRLRPHGVYYSNIQGAQSADAMLSIVEARRQRYQMEFAHWYVDGGPLLAKTPADITCVSYTQLNSLRLAVLNEIRSMGHAAQGPEGLQASLSGLRPEKFGAAAVTGNPPLDHFHLSVFTEGSGTQIFSTTFVQWTVHELLRRAQPLTVFVRFAPRQTQRSMDELLADQGESPALDAEGALVDADMAAFYIWIYQQRLPESTRSSFLVWFEDHHEAVLIAPGITPGSVSTEPISLDQVLARAQHVG